MQAHNEEHALQRGGSVSHRRAQSDCLQNRLPITQHFGKVRSDWAISHLHSTFCLSIHSCPHHCLICLFPTASCPVLHLHLLYCCCLVAIRHNVGHSYYWGTTLSLCFCCAMLSVTSASACSQTQGCERRAGHEGR